MKWRSWTWWIYRVILSVALALWTWKRAGLAAAIVVFVVVFVVDASAYYDGISVGKTSS